jgi:hypothetical protein
MIYSDSYTNLDTGTGVYSNWYLPSKDELNQMYTNKATINTTASAIVGSNFSNNYYWSSTEVGNSDAWRQSFGYGYQNVDLKFSRYDVRAVRAF